MKASFICLLLGLLMSCSDDNPEVEKVYIFKAESSPSNGGSVNPQQGTYKAGTILSVKATPNADYIFTGWSGASSSEENPLTLTIKGDTRLSANYKLREYPLSLVTEGEGTVKETVVSTRNDYSAGTVVELTALPDEGWQFKEWQGDLNGTENPTKITINDSKSIKAVFTKQYFTYKINIIGLGVVDEEIVETRSLEYGTMLQLTAEPASDKVSFMGWSGSVSGTDKVINVPLTESIEITATFANTLKMDLNSPLPDLMQPSTKLVRLYDNVDFQSIYSSSVTHQVLLDYNRDGILDYIVSPSTGAIDSRMPLRFFKGNVNGSFTIDSENDSKFEGLVGCRKIIYGDYNCDGYPDICFISHGYDAEPSPGDYPVILMSQGGPVYKDIRLTDYVSYYHGGASGDFDNDGDLDIVFTDSRGEDGESLFLVNDGRGNFTNKPDLIRKDLTVSMYTCEMYDVDNDGYLDLILAGHDHEGSTAYWENNPRIYVNMPIVFWGNGVSFNHDNFTRMPQPPINGYGVALNFCFADLNNDGIDEILIARTADGVIDNTLNNYQGWAIQVLESNNRSFTDVTQKYFDRKDFYTKKDEGWIAWIDVQKIGGVNYLMAELANQSNAEKMFEYINGTFRRVEENLFPRISNGFPIFSDISTGIRGFGHQVELNYNYSEDPYQGNYCIQVKEGWHYWDGMAIFLYNKGLDLSQLIEEDGYYLEFYIKNEDPNVSFDFRFECLPESGGDRIIHAKSFHAEKTKHDGSWEAVRVPLKDFCNNSNTDSWKRVKEISLFTTSESGKEFFLDEIRIRKIVDKDQ